MSNDGATQVPDTDNSDPCVRAKGSELVRMGRHSWHWLNFTDIDDWRQQCENCGDIRVVDPKDTFKQ